MKTKFVRGELTDISAKKEALEALITGPTVLPHKRQASFGA